MMMKRIIWLALLLPSPVFAWNLMDLWQTPDQQGIRLLQAGKALEASQVFKNKDWQAVATYRSNNFERAFKQFSAKNTSDSQYNAGNAAAHSGHYQEAIGAYDKAIALNPNNTDAISNREIVKKIMEKKQQQQQQQQQQNKSENNKKDKTDNNASPQNSEKHSSSASKNEKQNGQNNSQNNDNQQSQSTSSNMQHGGSDQQNEAAAASKLSSSNQDDSKNQLLRRLSDDPGGLLRQKFLRDYFRRHANEGNPDLGDENAL